MIGGDANSKCRVIASRVLLRNIIPVFVLLLGPLIAIGFLSTMPAEAQSDKARKEFEAGRQQVQATLTAGIQSCLAADIRLVGYGKDLLGISNVLYVLASCTDDPANPQAVFGYARDELRQETLAIGLAAMNTGKQLHVVLEDGRFSLFELKR